MYFSGNVTSPATLAYFSGKTTYFSGNVTSPATYFSGNVTSPYSSFGLDSRHDFSSLWWLWFESLRFDWDSCDLGLTIGFVRTVK